uniref:Uncharacterized protein n=1 Tax=Arundo donax TaxID=35708 RepID=A0A0A8YR45_ARUDO
MDVGKMGPILGSRAESLPVGDVRIAGLDALDLIFDESVVCGRNSLPLLCRSVP